MIWIIKSNYLFTIILLTYLFMIPNDSVATWRGKLDLNLNAEAVGIRELHDGNWLAGISKQLWHLEEDGKERLHVSVYQAWRAEHGDPAFGLSLGLNTGKLGDWFQDAIGKIAPELSERAKFVTQLSNWISLEVYGGYRFRHGPDVHDWIWCLGGKVRIPIDLIRGL